MVSCLGLFPKGPGWTCVWHASRKVGESRANKDGICLPAEVTHGGKGERMRMRFSMIRVLTLCLILSAAASSGAQTATIDFDSLIESDSPIAPTIDTEQLVLVVDGTGTIAFSDEPIDSNLPSLSVLSSVVRPSSGSDIPLLDTQPVRGGDYLVPIPAIGAGWALLMGAAMYRVGCRVLKVRS